MAQIETWYSQDLKKPVPVNNFGVIYNEDSEANKIGVRLFSDGVALQSISGSVTGYFLLADGTTTSIAGSKSGNEATVIVPPSAYKIPGPITITVRITDGNSITTVCACVGLIMRAKTPVATPAGSTVADWSAQISAELQACQDAADNLGSIVASAYSTIQTYAVGTYVTNSGNLYRCTTPVITAGSWASNSSKFTQVKVGDELNNLLSAINTLEDLTITGIADFDRTLSDFQTGYFWTISNDKVSKSDNYQSIYNEGFWDVSAYRGKTVEIICDTIGSTSGRRSGICDAEGNVASQKPESDFVLGEDGKYHATFSITEDYLFVSFVTVPEKTSITVHIEGEPFANILESRVEAVENVVVDVENKGDDPAPSGKFWMSTNDGAEWSDPITHGAPDFDKSISNLASGYFWQVTNGVLVKTQADQSLYNAELWDVRAYSGKTVEIVCDTINTGSGRKSGICDGEGNVSASASEDSFTLGTDGKYHKSFTVSDDYMFVSVGSYPTKTMVNVHIEGEPDTSIFYMAEQGEALEERMDAVDNTGSSPVTSGKVWTSTGNGAEWQTPSGSSLAVIQTPAGFGWANNPLDAHLFRSEAGITTDFDVASYRPTGKTYWVDPNGSDSNSGEDADHPLQLIKTAMNKSDAEVVVLKNGIYNYARCPQHLNGYSKSIAVVAAEGANPVICSEEGVPTFTKTDGYTYVYESAQRSSCVYDVVNSEAYIPVSSIAEVEATPGTYFSTNTPSNITYLRMKNDATPGYSNVKLCKTYDVFRITASGAITVYIEGLTICGGGYGGFRVTSDGTTTPKVYAKNCNFYGSLVNSALYLEGCESILQNCKAACAIDDGFGYHAKTVIPKAIEINCEGYYNGLEGATDNGSTMHDGGSIIRVNGRYHNNRGPNVADVHEDTTSWNLSCHAWKANISGQNTQNADFVCSDSGASMWLDNCSAYGSYYSLLANSTGKVYERGNVFVTRYVGDNCALESY